MLSAIDLAKGGALCSKSVLRHHVFLLAVCVSSLGLTLWTHCPLLVRNLCHRLPCRSLINIFNSRMLLVPRRLRFVLHHVELLHRILVEAVVAEDPLLIAVLDPRLSLLEAVGSTCSLLVILAMWVLVVMGHVSLQPSVPLGHVGRHPLGVVIIAWAIAWLRVHIREARNFGLWGVSSLACSGVLLLSQPFASIPLMHQVQRPLRKRLAQIWIGELKADVIVLEIMDPNRIRHL